MKNPFFWLAFTCVLGLVAYAMLHPSEQSLDAVRDLAIGILCGKYALASNGGGPRTVRREDTQGGPQGDSHDPK